MLPERSRSSERPRRHRVPAAPRGRLSERQGPSAGRRPGRAVRPLRRRSAKKEALTRALNGSRWDVAIAASPSMGTNLRRTTQRRSFPQCQASSRVGRSTPADVGSTRASSLDQCMGRKLANRSFIQAAQACASERSPEMTVFTVVTTLYLRCGETGSGKTTYAERLERQGRTVRPEPPRHPFY